MTEAARMFDPLDPDERRAEGAGPVPLVDDFEPLPVFDGAEPPGRHSTLGQVVARYAYRGAESRLEGFVCRYTTPEGKETRPQRYGRWRGRTGWHGKGWGDGRPLYRLPELLARPDVPVLIVEGEKTAEAAAELLPDFAVVTTMGGANAVGKTDLSPLAGRHVSIWPDNDEAGARYARDVARSTLKAGAASVSVVRLPSSMPPKWDLADEAPTEWGDKAGTARALIKEAPAWRPSVERQGRFMLCPRWDDNRKPGVYHEVELKDGEREWRWLSSLVEVVAFTRDPNGKEWGRVVRVTDPEGTVHEWAMASAMLAGDGAELLGHVLSLGARVASGRGGRATFLDYLSAWQPSGWARCVERVGWHVDGRNSVFALPDQTFGGRGGTVVLQAGGRPPVFGLAGTLEGWQAEIAAPAVGNDFPTFSVAASFASPLVYPTGEESGGFHFHGASSKGKSVCLHCCRSVFGMPLGSWRMTDNGAEAAAAGACDLTMTLDELGQGTAKAVAEIAYMIGNGGGKARMARSITARPPLTWRILFLSSGELGLAAKLGEDGRRAMAGQRVRVLEIAADAGKGLGVFDVLPPGFKGGEELAEHLRLAADRQHGHAGRAFLDRLTRDLPTATETVRAARKRFVEEQAPADADGQVKRAAGRFGLVAAAGELARAFGIVPWPAGAAERSAARLFKAWIAERGGHGSAEIDAGLRQVRGFFESHGASRFEPVWDTDALHEVRIINRAGFRRSSTLRTVAEDGTAEDQRAWTFFVQREAWRGEVCRGFDPAAVARAMVERGWLEPGDGKNLAKYETIPGVGRTRVYAVTPRFLAEGGSI